MLGGSQVVLDCPSVPVALFVADLGPFVKQMVNNVIDLRTQGPLFSRAGLLD